MGKRIRHLEFYGYADQNTYIGLPNADLSDIREVNREQDQEINAISGATKDKADLATVKELSGKVDTFVDKQDMINKWLAKGIKKNKDRIDKLERRDKEITDKINELVDDFNPIYDELGNLSNRIDDVDNRLTEHLAETSTFEDETKERLTSLENGLEKKMDKREAYHTFAKKSDVYTKEEVDDLIDGIGDGYATEDWVMSRGFIKEVDADAKYASKARLNALEDRVGDIQTTLYNQYNELNSDLSQFKTVTNSRIGTLYDRLDTLETKHDREIANVQEDIAELTEDVTKNSNDIYQINNVALPNKADKADLDTLDTKVNNLSNNLNNKVDKTVYEGDKARFGVQLDSLDNRKADKSEVRAVSGAIGDLADALEQEKQNRIAADNALGDRIDSTNGRIDEIREENIDRDEKISNLRRDLNKEINDRVEGDNSIIGSSSDREEDNTIYGAKKYAKNVANNALNEAKAYTDTKDSSVRDYVDETRADLERQITAKANKSYVDAVKSEIENSVDDKVNAERLRAQGVESSLENNIRQETLRAVNKENIISTALTHTSNIVKALTEWDGDDRIDYTDVGNGIVDVMHREIHDLKKKIGSMSLGIVTTNEYEFGIGTYNVSHTGFADSEKTVFSVGIGTSEVDRKNAIEIMKDGTIYILVNGEYVKLNDVEEDIDRLFADVSYNSEDHMLHFNNRNGVEVDSIDVTEFSTSIIQRAWYENGIIYIEFNNGEVITIDVGGLITQYTFSDGLQNISGNVSVLIDETSENFITVSANGLKVSGINQAINQEAERAISAETELEEAINQETERATSAETELRESIESSNSGLTSLIERLGYTDNDTLVRNNPNEVAFGRYNVSNTSAEPSGTTIFSIGIGTSDENRSNAVEVMENGDVYLMIEGEFMNINKLLGQIAHEVY